MIDVLVVGAGPAGSVAATLLARGGARVLVIDRDAFPRDKLCGDTVNPGTLATLRRLGLAGPLDECGLRIDGMRLTGEGGVAIDARYPRGLYGRALLRRDLDWMLLRAAIAAGASFQPGLTAERAIVDEIGGVERVAGIVARGADGVRRELRAPVTIAADGRRSTLAFGLGLARHPARPRRWAIGTYYEGVAALGAAGEMHVRPGRYIGVAPLPGGLANVCVVRPVRRGERLFDDAAALVAGEIARDSRLAGRFARARRVARPVVLGPLAIDASAGGVDGLIAAGDASGFVDPMTGDGLRFAVRGAELAADACGDALARGWTGIHARLASARRREFAAKWRFNRALRALVASPRALDAAAFVAAFAPSVVSTLVAYAGDCDRT